MVIHYSVTFYSTSILFSILSPYFDFELFHGMLERIWLPSRSWPCRPDHTCQAVVLAGFSCTLTGPSCHVPTDSPLSGCRLTLITLAFLTLSTLGFSIPLLSLPSQLWPIPTMRLPGLSHSCPAGNTRCNSPMHSSHSRNKSFHADQKWSVTLVRVQGTPRTRAGQGWLARGARDWECKSQSSGWSLSFYVSTSKQTWGRKQFSSISTHFSSFNGKTGITNKKLSHCFGFSMNSSP